MNIYSPRSSFFQQCLDTPQFIGRDSEFLIVIIMTGLGIKWSGSAGERRKERNLINLFQPISLSAQIRPGPDRDNTSPVICDLGYSLLCKEVTGQIMIIKASGLFFLFFLVFALSSFICKGFPIPAKSFIEVCVDHVCGVV